jgi:hypothetical protein
MDFSDGLGDQHNAAIRKAALTETTNSAGISPASEHVDLAIRRSTKPIILANHQMGFFKRSNR